MNTQELRLKVDRTNQIRLHTKFEVREISPYIISIKKNISRIKLINSFLSLIQ